MTKTLIFTLVAALLINPIAFAAAPISDGDRAMALYQEYLKVLRPSVSPPAATALDGAKEVGESPMLPQAKTDYITQQILPQIDRLEIDDFNEFVLDLMNRYVTHPEERAMIFSFATALQANFQDSLKEAALLRQGPADALVKGALEGGFWILIGLAFSKNVLLRTVPKYAMRLATREATLMTKPRLYRAAVRFGRTARSAALVTGLGAGAGIAAYYYKVSGIFRLDPLEALAVTQTNLACLLSYNAVDLNDKYTTMSASQLMTEGTKLKSESTELIKDITLLKDQFPNLNKLEVSDRAFQNVVNDLPKTERWIQLRAQLDNTGGPSQAHLCGEISLFSVVRLLSEMNSDIDQRIGKAQ